MSDILSDILSGVNCNTREPTHLSLKDRCATDLELFARTFFPEYFKSEWSTFHYDMVDALEDIILNKRDQENKFVVAAPRGHSKSTIFTFLAVMWCCCYGYKKVIVIISATNSIAKKFILDCRTELATNELIQEHFGNMKSDILWAATEFCTSNGVYVGGRGAGEQMRGFKWKGSRVDMCLIDDLETTESVSTQLQIDKMEEWFTGDVLPMGMPNCDFLYVGTIISYNSLLFKLMHEPRFSSWKRKLYSAVIKDSESPLWNTFEEIALDPARENSMDDAYEFYKEHKEELLDGVELLWEKRQPDMYLYLRVKKLENEDKYNSEFLNDPITDSTRVFKTEWLENNMYTELPEITEIVAAVDPSMGKKASDPSAIVFVGRGVDNYLYVLTADICRRKPDVIISDILKYIAQYNEKLKSFVVEINVMQEYLASNIKKKCLDVGLYVNWVEVRSRTDKSLRIMSMVPKIKHGYVKFHKSQATLLNQLRNYPRANDDGCDALQFCLEQLTGVGNTPAFSFATLNVATRHSNVLSLDQLMKERRRSFG